ncbi:MAG: terpene cyclase/mutase family protein [Anaerolineae bacterium]|nr:terpene cyclase/mutase family protein [Anaerolineae bacterium]
MYRRRSLSIAAMLALTLALSLAVAPPAAADDPAVAAWLAAQQNADGGFGSPDSAVGTTADVIIAATAAGDTPINWSVDGVTTLDYLAANAPSIVAIGDLAKTVIALTASGINPRSLGDDLIARLEGTLGAEGQYGESGMINDQAYAMIALASARRTVPAAAIDYLLARQIADGTWAWNGDTTPGTGDNNTAAIAVVALRAAGVPADHAQIQLTLTHLHGQQNEDGGFPYVSPSPYGTDSDANSTAVVMWAILAAGQDPAGDEWKYQGQDGASALDRMRAFQNESGAYRWQDAVPDDNLMGTVQAAVAAELKTLPFASTDVGEVAAVPIAATLPETGGNAWGGAIALLAAGALLAGVGVYIRRRV